MSQQFINIGYVVNDGTGDTLRDAFEKVNGNFNELFTSTLSGTSAATPNTVVRRDGAGGAAFLALEFKNEYATPSGFPAAASHTGMVAFAVSTGKEYYSNGSQWLQLSGALSTDELPEGVNLYFTNARARSAISVSGPTWVQFDRSTGIITFSDLSVSNISNAASIDYVDTSIANVLGTVAANLDTLGELADAINDDPQFFQSVAAGLDSKANINAPTFTGVPSAPTADPGTNTTQLATTAFVLSAVATGALGSTDDLTEGADNLYFTDTRARDAISVTGDLTYDPVTGILGYDGITSFSELTGVPTTISGYGITDAYTMAQVDTALTGKVSSSELADYYNKSDVDTLVGDKALAADVYNKTEVYTQSEVDTLVGAKANADDVYNKTETYSQTEVDSLIASGLSGIPETYTKAEVWNLLLNISNRLNEAGIPDLLGSLTAPVVVNEDWGSITDTMEMPEDYGNLTELIGY
jgi:hypothetical protein